MLNKIIKIFKVKNLFHLIIIFIVFGITGSLSLILGKYVLIAIFGESLIEKNFYWFLKLIIIFPLYQILLIVIGTSGLVYLNQRVVNLISILLFLFNDNSVSPSSIG